MGFKVPKPIGINALRAAVPRAMAARDARKSAKGKSFGATGAAEAPPRDFCGQHRVYVASIEDALNRQVLKNARPAGWRYFVLEGENTIATVHYSEKTRKLTSVNYSALAESTARAIKVAQDLPDVKKRDYDLGVLELPVLYLVILWLRSTGSNILIPLEPAPPGIEANRPYSQRELDSAIYTLAKRRMESHSKEPKPQARRRTPARRPVATIAAAPPTRTSTAKKRSAKATAKNMAPKGPRSKKPRSRKT